MTVAMLNTAESLSCVWFRKMWFHLFPLRLQLLVQSRLFTNRCKKTQNRSIKVSLRRLLRTELNTHSFKRNYILMMQNLKYIKAKNNCTFKRINQKFFFILSVNQCGMLKCIKPEVSGFISQIVRRNYFYSLQGICCE